jgi:glucose-6-phosphate isomerase
VFTAVGLLPASIVGIDVVRLLEGAAAMNRRFREAPVADNPVLQYVAVSHLAEVEAGATIRVLSSWSNRLEAVGLWYDQLLSESLGKAGQGATPLTAVTTRDLHSRGQQHQDGRRDKLITNLVVGEPRRDRLALPKLGSYGADQDKLDDLVGTTWPEMLAAAVAGTNEAYAGAKRPTADILLPRIDEHVVGQLLQMLMLATVVEGRLVGTNPYGQPGVEEAWVENVARPPDRIVGELSVEPRFLGDLKEHAIVDFQENQIVDWAFMSGDRLLGHYTTRVMLPQMDAVQADWLRPLLSETPAPEKRVD